MGPKMPPIKVNTTPPLTLSLPTHLSCNNDPIVGASVPTGIVHRFAAVTGHRETHRPKCRPLKPIPHPSSPSTIKFVLMLRTLPSPAPIPPNIAPYRGSTIAGPSASFVRQLQTRVRPPRRQLSAHHTRRRRCHSPPVHRPVVTRAAAAAPGVISWTAASLSPRLHHTRHASPSVRERAAFVLPRVARVFPLALRCPRTARPCRCVTGMIRGGRGWAVDGLRGRRVGRHRC